MTRIERPSWAREPDIWLRDIKLADYQRIQEHRHQLLKVVHREVEVYLNTGGLYFQGENDGFPNRSRMTGEYYVSDERYETLVGPVRYQIAIQCRCLGRRANDREVDDYLGLEVWLQCDPKKWAFEVFRNTDSSVI